MRAWLRNEYVEMGLFAIVGGGLMAIILPWADSFVPGSFLWQMLTTLAFGAVAGLAALLFWRWVN